MKLERLFVFVCFVSLIFPHWCKKKKQVLQFRTESRKHAEMVLCYCQPIVRWLKMYSVQICWITHDVMWSFVNFHEINFSEVNWNRKTFSNCLLSCNKVSQNVTRDRTKKKNIRVKFNKYWKEMEKKNVYKCIRTTNNQPTRSWFTCFYFVIFFFSLLFYRICTYL